MRTFLNHIKNETLDEIKTSLENLWQQMIQLSEFFQCSFVLILKRKCLVRASRVRSGESGTPSTIIYVRWTSRRYELGCDTPVVSSICWLWRPILGRGMGHRTTTACTKVSKYATRYSMSSHSRKTLSRVMVLRSRGPRSFPPPKNVDQSVWPHGFLVGPSNDIFYKATSRSGGGGGGLEADAMRWCDEEAVVHVESWCRNRNCLRQMDE